MRLSAQGSHAQQCRPAYLSPHRVCALSPLRACVHSPPPTACVHSPLRVCVHSLLTVACASPCVLTGTWRPYAVCAAVVRAQRLQLPLLLVHEQPGLGQEARESVSFDLIIASTPRRLLAAQIYSKSMHPRPRDSK